MSFPPKDSDSLKEYRRVHIRKSTYDLMGPVFDVHFQAPSARPHPSHKQRDYHVSTLEITGALHPAPPWAPYPTFSEEQLAF
ncbi:hypothetical protein SKAU_G00085830 [Synaphobranchus kaupii]|uniref:Uncharacterized protein n=1 Tax=Synaphobranchus kaupii TaxID=118154 RepID=A0A9Q1FVQ4_SYNKA|nr:hypothetical protein SKAU_G00085830 [Synaphobranchus kaupii]